MKEIFILNLNKVDCEACLIIKQTLQSRDDYWKRNLIGGHVVRDLGERVKSSLSRYLINNDLKIVWSSIWSSGAPPCGWGFLL